MLLCMKNSSITFVMAEMHENETASGYQSGQRRISLNHDLLRSLYSLPEVETWSNKTILNDKSDFVAIDAQSIVDTTKLVFPVAWYPHVERNENIYLFAQYLLRKEYRQKEHIFLEYSMPSEEYLYHCTPKSNIASICENNFDWRRSGTATGIKYGQGVNFTKVFHFATRFPQVEVEKCVIISRVLKGDVELGYPSTILPSNGCDTTCSLWPLPLNHVFVKYEDNEFYPEFIIHL